MDDRTRYETVKSRLRTMGEGTAQQVHDALEPTPYSVPEVKERVRYIAGKSTIGSVRGNRDRDSHRKLKTKAPERENPRALVGGFPREFAPCYLKPPKFLTNGSTIGMYRATLIRATIVRPFVYGKHFLVRFPDSLLHLATLLHFLGREGKRAAHSTPTLRTFSPLFSCYTCYTFAVI
jgi:hypothetical protein